MRHLTRKAPIRCTVTLRPKFSAELDAFIGRLDAMLASPEVLTRLLQQAVVETVLEAWRTRFLDELPNAVNMQRAAVSSGPASGAALDQAKTTLSEASQALTEAQLAGTSARAAKGKVTRAEKAFNAAMDRPSGPSSLSTGQFRPLAMQVLRALSEIATQANPNEIDLGIGDRSTLEKIKTPSATPMLTGHATGSQFNTLWKHLEFGTGVFASQSWNGTGSTKTKAGGWWYGPRKGFGVQLRGSQGVHAVFDPATGVPYMQDALRFEDVFAAMFTRALRGA